MKGEGEGVRVRVMVTGSKRVYDDVRLLHHLTKGANDLWRFQVQGDAPLATGHRVVLGFHFAF